MKVYHACLNAVRLKTFIRFSTENARRMVRAVLEPHPAVGLRIQDIYKQIHERFPDEKEKDEYLPSASIVREHIPNLEHPIRSMKYLKSTVIGDMERAGEVHQVSIKKGAVNEDGVRLDAVNYRDNGGKVFLPTDIQLKQEWRWRLNPSYVPISLPDPSFQTVIEAQSSPRPKGWHDMSRKTKARKKQERVDVQLRRYGRILV